MLGLDSSYVVYKCSRRHKEKPHGLVGSTSVIKIVIDI
jgi:hypothetical protein